MNTRDAITKWIDMALEMVAENRPVSSHLDEILSPQAFSRHPIDASLATFRTAADVFGVRLECSLLLCWPCGATPALEPTPPASLSECDGEEPPSLIILHSHAGTLHEEVEEYRRPVHASAMGVPVDNVVAYYRCFRDLEAIENDWEFSRALYFQVLHPKYQL